MNRASLFALSGLIAVVLMLASFASTCRAAIISVDWGVNLTNGIIHPTETAGAPGAAATNWNAFDDTATHTSLIDNSGGTTTASVSTTTFDGTFDFGSSFPVGGDFDMMRGGVATNSLPVSFTDFVTVSGVPYANYDVYVYSNSNTTGRNADYEIGAIQAVMTVTADSTYVLGQDYVILPSVSGSSFTLAMRVDTGGTTFPQGVVSGLQIVETPEPASLSLLVLGGVMILRRRGR